MQPAAQAARAAIQRVESVARILEQRGREARAVNMHGRLNEKKGEKKIIVFMRRVKNLLSILVVLSILSGSSFAAAKRDIASNPYYRVLYNHISRYQPPAEADWLVRCVLYYSKQFNIDPLLVTALYTHESRFRMEALSPTGAIGIAQLQPTTAQGLGVDPGDPEQNIAGGIRYLAQQMRRFSHMGEWTATYAIAAYNAGPGAIETYDDIPPYSETRRHINRICDTYIELRNAM